MTLPALALPFVPALIAPLAWATPGPPLSWQPPVAPLVVERPFLAPPGPYSPGHRGVDLAAEAGAIVRAPAPGVVRVAGRIAGKAVVSLEHPQVILGRPGWRTTYEGVLAGVDVGDVVRAGDPLGVVGGRTHARGIHWGLKNGRVYADPLLMLRRPIVLKPVANYARGCACS